jgi:hypothetical protein
MTDEAKISLITSIPRPREIRERIAAIHRERDVLTKLLRVSEYAVEQLPHCVFPQDLGREVSQ